jgi:Protein of unknown function (DUF1236).
MEENMKSTLLASVAAISLFAFTGLASAQSMNQGESKEAPPAASQKSETTAPAPKAPQTAQDKAAPKAQPDKAATDVKPDTKPSAATPAPAAGTTAKDSKAPAAGTTTGAPASGPAAAAAAPPAEKRTQIVSAIKQEKVQEVTNVNFNITIGAMVPSTVHYYRLPSRIVEIYPEWSGYEFILVRGKYIILRPRTHEIVYIIED